MDKENLVVAIIGSHGIPAAYGGFETFAENIAGQLVAKTSWVVLVTGDKEVIAGKISSRILSISLPYNKTDSPFRHYLSAFISVLFRADIIICCGPLGSLFAFVPRLIGKLVILNPDGLNSRRQKWSYSRRKIFAILEWFSAKSPNILLCDSFGIQNYYRDRFKIEKSVVIEYGAIINESGYADDSGVRIYTKKREEKFLQKQSYWLVVARMEPENNIREIATCFLRTNSNSRL